MFLLFLMLDDPRLSDRVLQAWGDLGIRGTHVLESAGCLQEGPAPPERGPTGFLSFAHLLTGRRFCYALLVAPVPSRALAEQAAEAVLSIAGPWGEWPTAMMFVLPVAAGWGMPGSRGQGFEEPSPGGRERA